jgi:hypothetical protein
MGFTLPIGAASRGLPKDPTALPGQTRKIKIRTTDMDFMRIGFIGFFELLVFVNPNVAKVENAADPRRQG